MEWGLPGEWHRWPYHPDESYIFLCIRRMSLNPFSLNPGEFDWPSLYLYSVLPLLGALAAAGIVPFSSDGAWWAAHPGALAIIYVAARTVTLAASLIGLAMMAHFMKRLTGNSGTALCLAAVLAATPVHLILSTVATPHMLSVVLGLTAISFTLTTTDTANSDRWPVTAFFWGLSVGTLYDAWILAVPIAVAQLLTPRPMANLPRFIKTCLLAVAVFFIVNPYILLSPGEFFESAREISGYLSKVGPNPLRLLELMPLAFGLPLTVVGLIGLGCSLAGLRRPLAHRTDLILSAWFLVTASQLILTGTDFLRRLLPLVIPVLVLAARALVRIPRGLRNVILLTMMAWNLALSLAYVQTYGPGDTRTAAKLAIEAGLLPGTRVGVINWFLGPHLDRNRFNVSLRGDTGFARIQVFVATDVEWPEEDALQTWPGASTRQRFLYKWPLPSWLADTARAPEDWFYTHPSIYVLDIPERYWRQETAEPTPQ